GAKILGAEVLSHHLTNVVIDVLSSDVDELIVAVTVFENFARWILQQASNNTRDIGILELTDLLHARLARKIKLDHIALYAHVFRTQRRESEASVFTCVYLTSGTQETG